MGITSNKLQKVLDSKEAIRVAIIGKGVGCEITVPFSQYSSKIASIEQGGSSNSLEEGKDFLLVDSPFPSTATLTGIACDNGDILLSTTTYNAGVYKLDRTTKIWTKILDNDYNIIKMFTDSLGNMYFISYASGSYVYKYSIDGIITKLNIDSGTGGINSTSNKWVESKYGDIIIISYSNSNDIYILNKTTNILEKKDSKGTGSSKYYYEAKNGDLYIFGTKLLRFNYNSSTWESYVTTLPSSIAGVLEKSTGEIFMGSGYSNYPYILMFSPTEKTIYTIYTGNSSNYSFSKIIEIDGVVFFSAEYTFYATGVLVYDETNKTAKIAYSTLCNYTAGFTANGNIYICTGSSANILKYNRETSMLEFFHSMAANVVIPVDGGYILGFNNSDNSGLKFFNSTTEIVTQILDSSGKGGLYPGMYFYDKNNVLCFYIRPSVYYWDSTNKTLVNISKFGTSINTGYQLIYRDSNGDCMLSSTGSVGLVVHRSITDTSMVVGSSSFNIISKNPIAFSNSANQFIKWDAATQKATINGFYPFVSASIIGKYRIGLNILFDAVNQKIYTAISPIAATTMLSSSNNNTYGVASINTNSVIKLLIV